jgi:hypothetical protein
MPASEEMESIFSRASQGAAVSNRPSLPLVDACRDAVPAVGFDRGGAAAERAQEDDRRKTGE